MTPATVPAPRRALVVANPVAGTTSDELVASVVELASSSLQWVSLHRTTHRGDATDRVRDALRARHPPDLVIAVGGDGTVGEVVAGMAGTDAAHLAIVPGGTGNSGYRMLWDQRPWADSLSAVLDPSPDAHASVGAEPRRIDLARVTETRGLVLLGACSGLVAETLLTARSVAVRGRARYARALVDTAASFTPYPGRVTVDGVAVHEGATVLANVGGGRHRGGQYLLLPYSELDDGLLDVCVIGGEVPPGVVPTVILAGDHVALPGVVYARGRTITVERLDGRPLCFECDGELHHDVARTMTLEVMPGALPVWSAPPARSQRERSAPEPITGRLPAAWRQTSPTRAGAQSPSATSRPRPLLERAVTRPLSPMWGRTEQGDETAGRRPGASHGPPTPLVKLARWAAEVRPGDVPDRVRELAASQVLSQLAAIRAGAGHPDGRRLVGAFGPPFQPDRRASACVLAGLGVLLNLDDTAYAGHLSNSTVAVPLAFAHAAGLSGRALLTAVVAANECAARITAAATLGPLRGLSAVHTHLAGAVAGRLHCEGAPAEVWVDALGLAFAMPNWPLMRALLGSDARMFGAFTPVRTAMDACDAARAGLHGAPDVMEHPDGFLARFATVGLPEAVCAGLGERWHTDTLSFKLRPGGPGIDAAVDCCLELHEELSPVHLDEIVEVVVETSLYTVMASRTADRYAAGPGSPLGVLVLHVPYPVATALLTGHLEVADFASPSRDQSDRWTLAARVRLVHDLALTRQLFAGEAPFGEAVGQAGPAAEPWLRSLGGDDLLGVVAGAGLRPGGDFVGATKRTGARVTVHLADGRVVRRERVIPLGAAGPHTKANHADLVRAKFLNLGGPVEVADAAPDLDRMDGAELGKWIVAALG